MTREPPEKGDEMYEGRTSEEEDERLLEELRRVVSAVDPVPDHVRAAAELALDWRTIDDELAELLYDSSAEAGPVGVRAEEQARVLSFGGERLRIELEVAGSGPDRTLTGQLDPAGPARVEIRHTDHVTTVAADARGRFRALSIPPGSVSLRCILDAPGRPRALATPWLPL
jgi:hypothetical protein